MKYKLLIAVFALALIQAITPNAFSQGSGDVKIEQIKVEGVALPSEAGKSSGNKILDEQWHAVEVKFSTTKKLTEELTIKFYMDGLDSLKQDSLVILTSEVTFINVPEGTEHYAVAYLPPGSTYRYGGNEGKDIKNANVHVEIMDGGQLVAQEDMEKDDPTWFRMGQQIPGVLISLKDSPFWPFTAKRYNQIKSKL